MDCINLIPSFLKKKNVKQIHFEFNFKKHFFFWRNQQKKYYWNDKISNVSYVALLIEANSDETSEKNKQNESSSIINRFNELYIEGHRQYQDT